MLKKFSITIGSFFLIVLLMGLLMSNEYEVKRSLVINAEPQTIHKYVEDLEQWPNWTHWQSADPKVSIKIGDIKKGEGAYQEWSGKSGVGILKITKSSVENGIDYMLDMKSEGLNTYSSIIYKPQGSSTEVTWTMKGKFGLPVIGTYIAMAMDGTAGPLFEQGLNKLKDLAENENLGPTDHTTKTQ